MVSYLFTVSHIIMFETKEQGGREGEREIEYERERERERAETYLATWLIQGAKFVGPYSCTDCMAL